MRNSVYTVYVFESRFHKITTEVCLLKQL